MEKDLATQFYNVLWAATAERDKRPEKTADLDGQEVEAWVRHERSLLLAAVNRHRKALGRDPVTESDIKGGEVVGHPEYGRRLATHCANLVTDGA